MGSPGNRDFLVRLITNQTDSFFRGPASRSWVIGIWRRSGISGISTGINRFDGLMRTGTNLWRFREAPSSRVSGRLFFPDCFGNFCLVSVFSSQRFAGFVGGKANEIGCVGSLTGRILRCEGFPG